MDEGWGLRLAGRGGWANGCEGIGNFFPSYESTGMDGFWEAI